MLLLLLLLFLPPHIYIRWFMFFPVRVVIILSRFLTHGLRWKQEAAILRWDLVGGNKEMGHSSWLYIQISQKCQEKLYRFILLIRSCCWLRIMSVKTFLSCLLFCYFEYQSNKLGYFQRSFIHSLVHIYFFKFIVFVFNQGQYRFFLSKTREILFYFWPFNRNIYHISDFRYLFYTLNTYTKQV